MTIDWGNYEIYDPGSLGPPKKMPRREARAEYKKLMSEKPERIELLRDLLSINGVTLASDNDSIDELNKWFRDNVEENPEQPGRLLGDWYSVVIDVALLLGDVMIERYPSLYWEFYIWGKTDISYQRHVIMGFNSPIKRKCCDIESIVSGYGHRSIGDRTIGTNRFSAAVTVSADKL